MRAKRNIKKDFVVFFDLKKKTDVIMYSKKEEIINLFKELSEKEKIEVKLEFDKIINSNKKIIDMKIEYEMISCLSWF